MIIGTNDPLLVSGYDRQKLIQEALRLAVNNRATYGEYTAAILERLVTECGGQTSTTA